MTAIRDEYDYLIHLTACALKGIKSLEKPDELSFQLLLEHGISHEIANLAFYSIEKLLGKPEEKLYARFKEIRDRAIVKDINQSVTAEGIRTVLNDAGISFYELQGTAIKPLYPSSDMRTMSDMDFIVPKEKLPLAKEVLSLAGHSPTPVSDREFHIKQKPNIFVEVHSDFTPDGGRSEYIHSLAVSQNEKDRAAALYIFSILHVAKHYFSRGCGIRRVMDVYVLNKALKEKLDTEMLAASFKKSGRYSFWKDISLLADYWFGETDKIPPRIEKMATEIKGASLHGVFSETMDDAFKRKAALGEKGIRSRYFIKRVFPSITYMNQLFPILGKHRYLLPVFWVWRILKGVFTKWNTLWNEFLRMRKGKN